MKTLREAREQEKIEEFIAERQEQPDADCEVFEATLASMARKSKSEPETSPPDDCED